MNHEFDHLLYLYENVEVHLCNNHRQQNRTNCFRSKPFLNLILMKLSSSDNVRKYFALHPFIVLNNEN